MTIVVLLEDESRTPKGGRGAHLLVSHLQVRVHTPPSTHCHQGVISGHLVAWGAQRGTPKLHAVAASLHTPGREHDEPAGQALSTRALLLGRQGPSLLSGLQWEGGVPLCQANIPFSF